MEFTISNSHSQLWSVASYLFQNWAESMGEGFHTKQHICFKIGQKVWEEISILAWGMKTNPRHIVWTFEHCPYSYPKFEHPPTKLFKITPLPTFREVFQPDLVNFQYLPYSDPACPRVSFGRATIEPEKSSSGFRTKVRGNDQLASGSIVTPSNIWFSAMSC